MDTLNNCKDLRALECVHVSVQYVNGIIRTCTCMILHVLGHVRVHVHVTVKAITISFVANHMYQYMYLRMCNAHVCSA